MSASYRKRVLVCASVVLVVAGIFFARRFTSSSGANAALPVSRKASAAAQRSTAAVTDSVGVATPEAPGAAAATASARDAVDAPAIYQQMLGALNEPISTERWIRIGAVLQGLSASNWKGVLQAFEDERKLHGRDHADARSFFVRRAGELIGREAVMHFLETKDTAAARSALTGWASKNPEDALTWLAQQSRESGQAVFVGDAIRGLALVEPDLAISFLESVPLAERRKYTPNLIATLVRSAGVEQAQKLVDDMISRAGAAGTLKERYLADVFRDLAQIKSKRANVSGNIDPAMDWLNQHIGQPYLDGYALRDAAAQFANQDPLKTIAWLDSVNARAKFPPFTAVGYGYVMDVWTKSAGLAPAAGWLNAHTAHPSYDRIASHYVQLAAAKEPALAQRIAGSIKDNAIRTATLAQLQKVSGKKK